MSYEYITVAESLRRNGYRHYCNGMKYLERGMTQHDRGSFAKAQKHYDKANLIDFMPGMFKQLANRIAESIVHG